MSVKQNVVNRKTDIHNESVNRHNKKILIYSVIEVITMIIVFVLQTCYIKRIVEKVDIADVICVGDERNDISMIEVAGIGVAMANAREELKAVADYVTVNDNNHGGIAEVIDKFILEVE